MNKKILLGSIIAVVILSLPSTIAVSELRSQNDELPDLSIENIYFYSRIPEWEDYTLIATIKNKGDVYVNESVQARVTILRFLFGIPIIPLLIITRKISFYNGIEPGESEDRWVADWDEVPKLIGFYVVIVNINIDRKLKEINYMNNFILRIFARGTVYWYPL